MNRRPRFVRASLAGLFWASIASGCGGTGSADPGPGSAADAAATPDVAGEVVAQDGATEEPETCSPASSSLDDRGITAVGETRTGNSLKACHTDQWRFVAAKGSTIRVEVKGAGSDLGVRVVWPDDPLMASPLATMTAAAGASASVEIAPERTGEFVITLGAGEALSATYDLTIECTGGCGLEATRYPIVLVHGWCGFDSVGPYEYFYGVPEYLEERGYHVEVAHLDPYNSTEVRSAQLAVQLDEFASKAHASRLDLIGHSQGGIDSRRAISSLGRGGIVATLVTVSTPHAGTILGDLASGLVPGPNDSVADLLLNLMGGANGHESDSRAAFYTLSEYYMRGQFAAENPDDPRVTYVSWGGHCCILLGNCGDVCDTELMAAYEVLQADSGDNDGLVPVSSMPHGTWRGLVEADHLDEIGQIGGITDPEFDHRAFYLKLARDLAKDGF